MRFIQIFSNLKNDFSELISKLVWCRGLEMRLILWDNFKDKATMDLIGTLKIYFSTYIVHPENSFFE